ncbi:MAG: signal peptidase I [Burkholderiales bacterium]
MNFALFMFLALVVTGAIWLLDIVFLKRRRPATAREPWWIEYPKSFFPVILVVFVLRSFLVEPFKIPSGSMIPTLQVGDFILVNKFAYGIRLPVIDKKIINVGEPHRGDVMVFRYPWDQSLDYIKRVVGVPGDHVVYRNKRLFINGHATKEQPAGDYSYVESGLRYVEAHRLSETLGGHHHYILVRPNMPPVQPADVRDFPFRGNCTYNDSGFACTVPPGHYFMMGDNRDASSDSRYWGFVPEANIIGKAFLIWWNFNDLKRIGTAIR